MPPKHPAWIEAWYSNTTNAYDVGGACVPYVVLLQPSTDMPGELEVLDPLQAYRVVDRVKDYESAIVYFNELSYRRVEGRVDLTAWGKSLAQ